MGCAVLIAGLWLAGLLFRGGAWLVGEIGDQYSETSLAESAIAWNDYAKSENCLAPTWFKSELRETPFVSHLPITTSSPLVRVCCLSLGLALVFVAATVAVNARRDEGDQLIDVFGHPISDWGQLLVTVFLLIPLAIFAATIAIHLVMWLLVVGFMGEDFYVCYQFSAFIVISFSMITFFVTRFQPLVKLLKSKKMLMVQLGFIGVVIETAGLGFTLRDIFLTAAGLLR